MLKYLDASFNPTSSEKASICKVEAYDFLAYTKDILEAAQRGFQYSEVFEDHPILMFPRFFVTLRKPEKTLKLPKATS